MIHIFQKGTKEDTFIVLHGTGGNEKDLIPIASLIDSDANILSIRGQVNENGMLRYFKRLSLGVFDLQNLKIETQHLYQFIQEAAKMYQLNTEKIHVIGYSNGANMALSLMFTYEFMFKKAILFHPMIPFEDTNMPRLTKSQIFISAGLNDPLVTKKATEDLIKYLRSHDADVSIYWTNAGHALSQNELNQASLWYKNREI